MGVIILVAAESIPADIPCEKMYGKYLYPGIFSGIKHIKELKEEQSGQKTEQSEQ